MKIYSTHCSKKMKEKMKSSEILRVETSISFFETPPHGAKRHPAYFLRNHTSTVHAISYVCLRNSKEGI